MTWINREDARAKLKDKFREMPVHFTMSPARAFVEIEEVIAALPAAAATDERWEQLREFFRGSIEMSQEHATATSSAQNIVFRYAMEMMDRLGAPAPQADDRWKKLHSEVASLPDRIRALGQPGPGGVNVTGGIPSDVYVAIGRERYLDVYEAARAAADSVRDEIASLIEDLLERLSASAPQAGQCPRCKGNGRIEMLEHCPECIGDGKTPQKNVT